MKKFQENLAISFDDILLIPKKSNIATRKDISVKMGEYELPIVSSPMDTVSENKMVAAISKLGGLGIIHRYMDKSKQLEELSLALSETNNKNGIGVAISSKDAFDSNYIKEIITLGCTLVCIDTANGHSQAPLDAVIELKINYPKLRVMVGNVATSEGFVALANAGADYVRVGIGGGSVCTTRIVTGHGVPTLQSLLLVKQAKDELQLSTKVVADGGLRNSGDIVKAFAAGADLVMLGSLLAGCEESPGVVINGFKAYRGMASKEAQQEWRDHVSVEEGISTVVEYKGSVDKIINELVAGVKSGCSYSGVNELSNLHDNAEYIVVSTATMNESKPHAKK